MKNGLVESLYAAGRDDAGLDALLDRFESFLINEDILEPEYLDDDAADNCELCESRESKIGFSILKYC